MRKDQIEIVKKHILRCFLNIRNVGIIHVNRQEIRVKKISCEVIQKAIDELIMENFLETYHKERISINPRMIKVIGAYLERI